MALDNLVSFIIPADVEARHDRIMHGPGLDENPRNSDRCECGHDRKQHALYEKPDVRCNGWKPARCDICGVKWDSSNSSAYVRHQTCCPRHEWKGDEDSYDTCGRELCLWCGLCGMDYAVYLEQTLDAGGVEYQKAAGGRA